MINTMLLLDEVREMHSGLKFNFVSVLSLVFDLLSKVSFVCLFLSNFN